MSNPTSKICPMLSKGKEIVYCNENCAWFSNDGIPSMCMMKDCLWTLNRIEQQLEKIFLAMPIEED